MWNNVKEKLPKIEEREDAVYVCSDEVLMTDGEEYKIGKFVYYSRQENFWCYDDGERNKRFDCKYWMKIPQVYIERE